jgi:ADP-heptose:LPS heptosyltransferase
MKKNKKFVFIGTGEEKEKIDKMIIRKNIGKNCYNFSGKFDLIETAYLISKSKLFLGINSGPMYLADIFDVPTIILFGRGSNEKIWGLGGKRNLTLKKDSIKNISAKTVSEVAEKLLLKYNNF